MKNKKLIFFALPFFALILTGCVKYNGKGSPNPVEKVTITLDNDKLSVVEGSQGSLKATLDKEVDVYWAVENDSIVSLNATEGLNITFNALIPGQTKITASATYSGRKYSKDCTVSVTRKSSGGGGEDGDSETPVDPTDPVTGETVTTYLVIGENGRYKGEPGVDIPSMFLEYAIEFTAEVGADLPTSEEVTSVVNGSKFQAWQSYEGGGALTKYTKVPNARGKILYASFSGGEGGVTPDEPPVVPTGSVTLYFAGINNWTDETAVNLGINGVFVAATKQSDNNYKATIDVSGEIQSVNAYLNQNGQDGKYFHPTTGVEDYNRMNSTINTGSINVELGGTYTITFVNWAYAESDWNHAWFNYTFTSGAPSDDVTPVDPPIIPTGTINIYFTGIESWTDPTVVHIAVDGNFKDAVKQSDGKYKAEFTVAEASSISCYLSQNGDKYFHPANGEPWDEMDSSIHLGSVTLTVGNSYLISMVEVGGSIWAHNWDNWQHAWFNYTFTQM